MRSLWTEIDILSTLEGEQKVVESVIRGQGDQYIFGGQDLSVKIPAVLHENVEQLSHQVRSTGRKRKILTCENVCIS